MSCKILTQQTAQSMGLRTDRFELLNKKLEQWVDENQRQCIATKVLKSGEPIFEGCYGPSNTLPNSPEVQFDTIFPVASITKPFMATLLLQLQEDGELDLCDKVVKYLPKFGGEDKAEINIINLLTHTSGMWDEGMSNDVRKYLTDELNLTLPDENSSNDEMDKIMLNARQLLKLPEMEDKSKESHDTWEYIMFNKVKSCCKPNEQLIYCNTGFQLCKEIITKLYNRSIEEIAQERIFKPLGMMDSHFIMPKEKWDRVVRRAENCEGYPWQNEEDCFINQSGAGGLKSTVNDILKFCEMIRQQGVYNGKHILSRMSVEAMWKDYNHLISVTKPFDAWALGFNYRGKKFDDTGILRSATCIDHGGWGGTKFMIDKENELSMACFTVNVNGAENIFAHYANIVYSSLL